MCYFCQLFSQGVRQGSAEAVPLQDQERLPDSGQGGRHCQGPLQEAGVEHQLLPKGQGRNFK